MLTSSPFYSPIGGRWSSAAFLFPCLSALPTRSCYRGRPGGHNSHRHDCRGHHPQGATNPGAGRCRRILLQRRGQRVERLGGGGDHRWGGSAPPLQPVRVGRWRRHAPPGTEQRGERTAGGAGATVTVSASPRHRVTVTVAVTVIVTVTVTCAVGTARPTLRRAPSATAAAVAAASPPATAGTSGRAPPLQRGASPRGRPPTTGARGRAAGQGRSSPPHPRRRGAVAEARGGPAQAPDTEAGGADQVNYRCPQPKSRECR